MTAITTNRGRTAITRKSHSFPYRRLFELGVISPTDSILDYGCGKGYDFLRLQSQGFDIRGFDRFHEDFNRTELITSYRYDSIICNYVFNVIESKNERWQVLSELKSLTDCIYITVRADKSSVGKKWKEFGDGWLTTTNTFQKFYDMKEIQSQFNYGTDWEMTVISYNSNEIMIKLQKVWMCV